MSTPKSRLASFRSYSYYHVLAMCDSTETADALAASTQEGVWDHATADTRVADNRPGTQDLGPYSPKRVEGAGKYIILINGATDASFVIETAKWTTATGASAVPGDKGTSLAIEGSIRISEPKGIAFLDQVVKCSVALGVDSSQVVYVIKTFFVGFGFNETQTQPEYSEHITDIPPLTFLVYDVTGSFNEAGGSYEMKFVAAGHGAARLPQYSKAVNAMSVTAGASLEQTLKRLQDNINENYAKYFTCVYEQIRAQQGDTADILRSLRKVNYVIEVGEDYKDKNGIKYVVTNQSQQYKNGAGCSDPAQVTFPAHTSIENAISTIMMMSPQVQADMSTGDTANRAKYEYKVHSALVSKQAPDAEEGVLDFTIYYRVERFLVPKDIVYNAAFQTLSQDDEQLQNDPNYRALRDNIIEFDYLYTGKNIDILEFEMKVNMGLAYLQTATLANTFKTQIERAPNKQMQPSASDLTSHPVKFGAIVQTPIFFGTQIRTPSLTNSNNGTQTIQSAYTLSKHSSLEVAEASMRIMGNTAMLGQINLTSSSGYVVKSADAQQRTKTTYDEQGVREPKFTGWSFIPAYVKVRVKMPRENDDFSLFTGQSTTGDPRTDPGATDYARDFWFDGYYYVVGIEHVFDNGEFTQNLEMIGIPKKSSFEASKDNATKGATINSSVGTCYDNAIGATQSQTGAGNTTTSSTVPHTPPSGDTAPTNTADANAVNANPGNRSLSNVRGWDAPDPRYGFANAEVKAAILDAANKYTVSEVTMAQFAAHESGFNASAKAGTSSATGLYQFIKGTWDGLVKQGRIFGVTDTTVDKRLDPKFNAYGGAAFLKQNAEIIGSSDVGDLYLAHFLGPGSAKRIIDADNRSGGKTLFIEAVDRDSALRAIRANSTILNTNSTVGEVRAWAAKSMAKTLKNGIVTAPQRTATTAATGTGGTVKPTTQTSDAKRTASTALATQQNTAAQTQKTDVSPCGPTADRPTKGG